MGKKSKNKRLAGSSSGEAPPSKKQKISRQAEPQPEPQPIMVDYAQMPLNHKKKFFIYDDCGSMHKYIGIISWLRSMGCFSGTVFHGIENLNWVDGQEYPLVEIEVETPSGNSAKFIISKNDLYVIAFYAQRWFQFSRCGFKISDGGGENFTNLGKSFTGAYTSEP